MVAVKKVFLSDLIILENHRTSLFRQRSIKNSIILIPPIPSTIRGCKIVMDEKICLFEQFLQVSILRTFKVNKRNTRARCKICSKLTRKTPERRQ